MCARVSLVLIIVCTGNGEGKKDYAIYCPLGATIPYLGHRSQRYRLRFSSSTRRHRFVETSREQIRISSAPSSRVTRETCAHSNYNTCARKLATRGSYPVPPDRITERPAAAEGPPLTLVDQYAEKKKMQRRDTKCEEGATRKDGENAHTLSAPRVCLSARRERNIRQVPRVNITLGSGVCVSPRSVSFSTCGRTPSPAARASDPRRLFLLLAFARSLSLSLPPSPSRSRPPRYTVAVRSVPRRSRDCLSRPAVSKANDLPWNLDNLSARLQPPRPGLHLFCTRVGLSLSLSFSVALFLSLSHFSFARLSPFLPPSLFVSFRRDALTVSRVFLTRPLGDH